MSDLIERYIYAVTKGMKPKVREDVQRELHTLIEDMLAERCGDLPPTEKDIRVVLTELGSPRELREKYEDSGNRCLIGQPHYSMYIFVLKIVLIAAAVGLTLGLAMEQLVEPRQWMDAVTNWLSSVWNTLLAAFAFVTILFAVLYRRGVKVDHNENLDQLPPVPKKKQQIRVWEPVVGIVVSVVVLVVFLAVPQVFCIIETDVGRTTPLFDPAVIRGSWYLLALSIGCGVIREVVKLMERRYSPVVAVTTLVTNGLSALFVILWGTRDALIHPAARERLAQVFSQMKPEDRETITKFLGDDASGFARWLLWLILGIIVMILVIDAVVTVLKSIRK